MKNIFESSSSSSVPRNRFNLTHSKKLSFNQGWLIPVMVKEAVPGDTFRGSHEIMVRCAPMVAPAYTKMKVKCETFFVPKRLLWDEFETWITGGDDGLDVPVHPYFLQSDLFANYPGLGSLWDYMGLPLAGTAGESAVVAPKISVLPFRAYSLIWNEWYRIPEMFTALDVPKTSGSQDAANWGNIALQRRLWGRDYFTTCQPNAQRGAAAAAPIDVVYRSQSDLMSTAGVATPVNSQFGVGTGTIGKAVTAGNLAGGVGTPSRVENISSASLLVEKFRIANAVQKFLEAMARGGSRYVEQIWQMFRVRGRDARLQRPEFISGSTGNIMISEVLSTVQFEGAEDDLPQGNMAGHGLHVGSSRDWSYRADEHGFFITLCSVVPDGGQYGNGLYSGIDKMWQRFDKYDEYWPLFAGLGEQAVLTRELSYNPDIADGNSNGEIVFGYAPRYSEYKWAQSSVHGDFRTSLEHWHQHRGWTPAAAGAGNPVLNSNFLPVSNATDDLDRIFAVTDPDVHKLWCMCINRISAIRPMPYQSMPGL